MDCIHIQRASSSSPDGFEDLVKNTAYLEKEMKITHSWIREMAYLFVLHLKQIINILNKYIYFL